MYTIEKLIAFTFDGSILGYHLVYSSHGQIPIVIRFKS